MFVKTTGKNCYLRKENVEDLSPSNRKSKFSIMPSFEQDFGAHMPHCKTVAWQDTKMHLLIIEKNYSDVRIYSRTNILIKILIKRRERHSNQVNLNRNIPKGQRNKKRRLQSWFLTLPKSTEKSCYNAVLVYKIYYINDLP